VLPLRDVNKPSRPALVTYALIGVNVLVFAHEMSLGEAGEGFLEAWGVVPARFAPSALFTSMFLHAGVAHLFGNMWFLHIFGDNVEDRLGRWRYLFFYLASGCAAGIAQVMVDPASKVPMVGASGAIAGVTGAYLLMFPHARVHTLAPLFMTVEVPAYLFLLFWFVMQIQGGCSSLASPGPGVAFFAHIGGFVTGAVLTLLLARTVGGREIDTGDRGWV
jgi:membrane associated rhomboid family serine protease